MEQTQHLCTAHKQPVCSVLFSSESYQQIRNDSVLKCIDCVIEQQINGKDLISFSELQNPSNASITAFNSLPLNQTQVAQMKGFQDKYSSSNFAQTRQQIKNFFSSFLQEVSEKIQFLEKEALLRLDQNEQNLQRLLKPDLFKTFKQNLLSIILAGRGNSIKLNDEVKQLIQAYKAASVQRFEKIEQDLANLQKKLFLFSEEKSRAQKEKVLEPMQHVEKFLKVEKNACLKEFELIKSGLEVSDQAIISRNEDGELIFKNPKEGRIFAYSNLIIDPKLKYLITVEIHNQARNGYQLIGLTEDELKDNELLWEQDLAFSNYSEKYGLTKKIKGECFTQSLNKAEHFELQIQMCLQDKLFIYLISLKRTISMLLMKKPFQIKNIAQELNLTMLKIRSQSKILKSFNCFHNFYDKFVILCLDMVIYQWKYFFGTFQKGLCCFIINVNYFLSMSRYSIQNSTSDSLFLNI